MPAMLLPDNLVTVFEKAAQLEVKIRGWVYLQKFGRLNLLFVSRSAMNSMLFHLRDLTKLTSYNFDFLADNAVMLEKSGSPTYRISNWFAFWMLAKDVLRLHDCAVEPADRQIHVKEDELPIESLVKMALFQDSPLNQERSKHWDLGGSTLELNTMKVYVHEDFGCIGPALNVNAENLKIKNELSCSAFPAIIVSKLSGLVADRIKNFRMVNIFPEDAQMDVVVVHDQLRDLAHYILSCCPELVKLTIELAFDLLFRHFESYVRRIKLLNEMLKNGTLMNLETHGCELIIATRALFPRQTLTAAIQNGHDVTKMGERFNIEQEDGQVVISRQVMFKEKFVARHTLVGYGRY